MKIRLFAGLVLSLSVFALIPASAQPPQAPPGNKAAAQPAPADDAAKRAESYYDFTMAHLYEQQFQASNRSDDANAAIDFYKKAYALNPDSQEIGEQLAEMYFVAQRTRDAVAEVQQMLQKDPANLAARRLLSRIYIRALGDLTDAADQQHTIALAIEQLNEVVRLDPNDADSAIWLARLDRLSNLNDKAEQTLRTVLQGDPQNASATAQLAQLLLDETRTTEAITLLEEGLKQSPSASLYDQLGSAYVQTREPAKAAEAYRQAVTLDPDDPAHLQGLAQALFDLGDYPGALVQDQKLVAMQPNDAGSYLLTAATYRRMNQLSKAEEQVLLAKQHAPGSLEILYNEALIYQDEGRFDDSIHVLTDAVNATKSQSDIAPTRRRTLAILYQLLGQVYKEADKTASAVSVLQEMAQLGPEEDHRARWLIVDAYRSARDLPHAFDAANKALMAYPMDRTLLVAQAMLYGQNNQPDQASQILTPMLTKTPADLEIYLDLAQIYQDDKKFGDAEQALHSAEGIVTRAVDRETVAFLFGAVYEHQMKYDQAEQAFKSVLAIDPRNAQTLNYYGYMLAERNQRLDEAHSLISRALADDPTNGSYLDSLGWTYFRQNKLAEAEMTLREAAKREPHNPTILSHLGDTLARSGQNDLAAAEWQLSLNEWRHEMPAEFEADKVAELEQKLAAVSKNRATPKTSAETRP